jgi:Chaperone of endosialidase
MQFNNPTQQKKKVKNMTIPHFSKSIGRSLSWRCGFVLIPLALVCFGLSPTAKAQLPPPPPDGGYPGANTAEGDDALLNLTSGLANTAVGNGALRDNTTGGFNVAVGSRALASNTTGSFNMAIGTEALTDNNANFNLAIGFRVGFMNTTGNHLTGIGAAALRNNTTAGFNTAIGADAMRENTTGEDNTAIGADALSSNVDGADNTAIGSAALLENTTSSENTAVGNGALSSTTADSNTAVGFSAMTSASGGNVDFNTAVGWNALVSTTANANVAIGDLALENDTSGFFNTAIGAATGINQTTGNNNIYIGQGSFGVPGESNTCYIQEIYTNIQPVVGVNPDFVTVNTSGKLGRANISSRRYKHDIKPMDKASEKLYELKPVSFRYNKQYDATQTIAFGLIAEDVDQVYPDLVGRNPDGQPESVRYEQINAMLLNEFLKEHKKVEEQQAAITELKSTVAQQQKGMEVLTAQLKEQTAQIQKVSAQIEMSKPIQKVAANQ